MQKHEETLTSSRLSAAVLNLVRNSKAGVVAAHEDDEHLDTNENIATMRSDAGGQTSDEDAEQRWDVIKVTDARMRAGFQQYQVLWEDTQEGGRGEETWEDEETLRHDGMGHKIAGFWRSNRGRLLQEQGFGRPL